MPLPNVNIVLSNGNLGRVTPSADGVAGLVLTGTAVSEKLELNKHYQLSGTSDLATLGVTAENNFLVDKEVRAFYGEAGEGQELHLLVVAEATTLTAMAAADPDAPLNKLVELSGGRVKLVGLNKIAPAEYTATVTKEIDEDAITAATAVQKIEENQAVEIRYFRALLPACGWNGQTEKLFKPRENTTNGVAFVLASDDPTHKTAAIGQVLGRAARIGVHQSIARVKDGAIAVDGWLTDGRNVAEASGLADLLHEAGYIIYRTFPRRNGCYLNDDPTAAPVTDDYSQLYLGRVVDKARSIIYDTYLDEVKDNVIVGADGKIPQEVCSYYESRIDTAVLTAMDGEISAFESYVDPDQDILSDPDIEIRGSITPLGVIENINFTLGFKNSALNQ